MRARAVHARGLRSAGVCRDPHRVADEGDAETGCVRLDGRLLGQAQRSARSAVSAFAKDQSTGHLEAVVPGGAAVEMLVKAYLASVHPVLLAEPRTDVGSLLHLIGRPELTKQRFIDLGTIGGHEAALRCQELMSTLRYTPKSDQIVFQARNAGTHIAFSTRELARERSRS